MNLDDLMLPGEELLWSGAPERGIHFRKEDRILIPFSVAWCGFAVFWEFSALAADAPLLFKIWGIPFVLIGLYIAIGRFFVAARRAAGTVYAVTNRRILFVQRETTSVLPLNQISYLKLQSHRNGLGTILFEAEHSFGRRQINANPLSGLEDVRAFRNIRDSKKVYRLLEELINPSNTK